MLHLIPPNLLDIDETIDDKIYIIIIKIGYWVTAVLCKRCSVLTYVNYAVITCLYGSVYSAGLT